MKIKENGNMLLYLGIILQDIKFKDIYIYIYILRRKGYKYI